MGTWMLSARRGINLYCTCGGSMKVSGDAKAITAACAMWGILHPPGHNHKLCDARRAQIARAAELLAEVEKLA